MACWTRFLSVTSLASITTKFFDSILTIEGETSIKNTDLSFRLPKNSILPELLSFVPAIENILLPL